MIFISTHPGAGGGGCACVWRRERGVLHLTSVFSQIKKIILIPWYSFYNQLDNGCTLSVWDRHLIFDFQNILYARLLNIDAPSPNLQPLRKLAKCNKTPCSSVQDERRCREILRSPEVSKRRFFSLNSWKIYEIYDAFCPRLNFGAPYHMLINSSFLILFIE